MNDWQEECAELAELEIWIEEFVTRRDFNVLESIQLEEDWERYVRFCEEEA